jgi:alpha-tubulin suppressor-like RCC1 family protein
VVLYNVGRIHHFRNGELWSRDHCDKEQSGSFTIRGHKIHSIASGYYHGIMVMMKGAVLGFGHNDDHQLGVVDPSAQSNDIVSTPTEVFVGVTKFKGVVRLPDGKEL